LPRWIISLSFLLSYSTALGIIIFASNIKKHNNYLVNYLKENLTTSLAAQVFAVPIIFIYFHEVSLIAPLANVLVAWIIAAFDDFGIYY
jgi:predicted membrane metal-binding protein